MNGARTLSISLIATSDLRRARQHLWHHHYAGANDAGCVYKLSRHRSEWTERVLYSFSGGTGGSGSIANLNFDAAGNLYGTTSEGGAGGDGVIFKLVQSGKQWTESIAHSFSGPPDGAYAYNGMVDGESRTHYGAR